MSLSRLATRLITARALSGVTLAEGRVFDSAVTSIDQMAVNNREPFLIVLTDDHSADGTGRDMRLGDDSLDLVIEVAVAQRVEVQVPAGGGPSQQVILPYTDAGMELVIDLICQQVIDALMGGQTPWQALWRRMVMSVRKVSSRRGASANDGARFAARQMIITCDILAAPVRGQALGSFFTDFIAALQADPEQAHLVPMIRYVIEGDAALTTEDLIASTLGISHQTVDFLGLAPVRNLTGGAVALDEVGVDVTDQADSPWPITATDADEQGV